METQKETASSKKQQSKGEKNTQKIVRNFRRKGKKRSKTTIGKIPSKVKNFRRKRKKKLQTMVIARRKYKSNTDTDKTNSKQTEFFFNFLSCRFEYEKAQIKNLSGPVDDETLIYRIISEIENSWKIGFMRSGVMYTNIFLFIVACLLYFTKYVPLACLALGAVLFVARDPIKCSFFNSFLKTELDFFQKRYKKKIDEEKKDSFNHEPTQRFRFLDYEIEGDSFKGENKLILKVWNPRNEPFYVSFKRPSINLDHEYPGRGTLETEEKRLNTEEDDVVKMGGTLNKRYGLKKRKMTADEAEKALEKTRRKLKKIKTIEAGDEHWRNKLTSIASIILDEEKPPGKDKKDKRSLSSKIKKRKDIKIKKRRVKSGRETFEEMHHEKNFNFETIEDMEEDKLKIHEIDKSGLKEKMVSKIENSKKVKKELIE